MLWDVEIQGHFLRHDSGDGIGRGGTVGPAGPGSDHSAASEECMLTSVLWDNSDIQAVQQEGIMGT